MRSTLFHIPLEIAGLPLFGFGLLLAIWVAVCALRIGITWYRRGWTSELWGEVFMMLLLAAVIAKVLPALCDSEGLPLRGYGVMVFLGVVAGVALAAYRVKKEGYDPELIYNLALWMCIGGIVGARLFYIIEYWDEYQKPTLGATLAAIINYTKGGLVVYGAFAGGAAALVAFLRRHKLPVLKLCDVVAPSLLVGLTLGRIGCFLNGCCYGGQCDLPWAVTFPGNSGSNSAPASPPYLKQASTGKLILHGIHFEPNAAAPAIVRSIDADSPVLPSGLRRRRSGGNFRRIAQLKTPPGILCRRSAFLAPSRANSRGRGRSAGSHRNGWHQSHVSRFRCVRSTRHARLEPGRTSADSRAQSAGASHATLQCHRRAVVGAVSIGLVSTAAARRRSDGADDFDLPDHAHPRRKHPHR